MSESYFPPEVPRISDSVRVTTAPEDLVLREYRFFCEESYVTSRFFAIDYDGGKHVELSLGGERIKKLCFNLESRTWSTYFEGRRQQVEVELLLE